MIEPALRRCAKCRRMQPDDELTRTTTITPFYVCRSVTDCDRASKCRMCQLAFIHEGAS